MKSEYRLFSVIENVKILRGYEAGDSTFYHTLLAFHNTMIVIAQGV